MKTNVLSLFCIVLLFQCSYGQGSNYYWYNGNKVYLTISMDWLQVEVYQDFQKASINNIGAKAVTEHQSSINGRVYNFAKVEFNSSETEGVYYQRINALRNLNTVKGVYPYFKRGNAQPISTSNIFYVKLKSSGDLPKLQQVASQKGVEILGQMPYMPLWYRLSLSSN